MMVALLGLLIAGLAFGLVTGDASEDDDEPAEGIDPGLPLPDNRFDDMLPPDTGASVIENDDGTFTVELGEDETGSLVLINYTDTEDAGIGLQEFYQQRLYLLPEGVTLPETDDGVFDPATGAPVDLAGFVALYDLELLQSWDLGSLDPIPDEPYVEDNSIDGDEILSVRPEGYEPPPPLFNGAPEQLATEDQTGTAGSDWLSGVAPGLTLDGAAGDDRLEASADGITLIGGGGNDDLRGIALSTEAFGGRGDDSITMADGIGRGGSGDDVMTTFGPAAVFFNCDSDDDVITIYDTEAVGFGGAGDDTINLNDGATGDGNTGNDRIHLGPGTVGHGGPGDDLLTVWNQHDATETPVATGGTGADTFDMAVWNAFGTSDTLYTRITDFDPAEDVLQVGAFQTQDNEVDFVEIAEDATGSHTEVLVHFRNTVGLPPGIATLRVDGVTGLTADQVVIVT